MAEYIPQHSLIAANQSSGDSLVFLNRPSGMCVKSGFLLSLDLLQTKR